MVAIYGFSIYVERRKKNPGTKMVGLIKPSRKILPTALKPLASSSSTHENK